MNHKIFGANNISYRLKCYDELHVAIKNKKHSHENYI